MENQSGPLQGWYSLQGAPAQGRSGLSGEQGKECVFPGQGPLRPSGHYGGRWEEVWLRLPWEGLAVSQKAKGRAAGSCVHRGSLTKLLLLFLRLALVKGMSRDSRRKGRGWGISGAWVGGMAELLLRGQLRPGGEL